MSNLTSTVKAIIVAACLVSAASMTAQNDGKSPVGNLAKTGSDSTISVGYATGNTLTLSGSVDKVTEKGMNKEQITNPLEAINGRVAGLSIQHSNNGVAAMSAVRLRGTTSLTGGNDPLIIVDGVFGDLTTLSSVYPTDIESFTILKDASETAQYGSRGASGVIEVTTKKGTGLSQVSYNSSFGFTSVYKNLNMLSADGYRNAVTAAGLSLVDKGYNTNWQEEIEQTGFQQDHHIAFTGGTASSGYRVSLGFMDHNGVILHDNLRNFTSNMNMYQSMFKDFVKAEVGMFGNIQNNHTAIYDVQKTFYSAAAFNPTFSTSRNENGGWNGFTDANQINNPLALMDSRTKKSTTHISTHARLTFNISAAWKLSLFGAYTHDEVETSQYLPTSIWAHGQAYKGTAKTESLLGNVVLSFNKTLGLHHIDALALAEVQRDNYNGFHTTATNFSTNEFGYDNLQAGALTLWEGTGSYHETPSLSSFMGRVTYDYANRYSLTLTTRADGSSKFGDNNKWGFFPSLSGAWIISSEGFMKECTWLDNLKLRAGYGLAGNQGGIDSYMSMNLVEPSGIVPVGQSAAVSLAMLRNTNPDLKWEKKHTFNAGIDAAFLGNRIIASVDFYTSKTTDMLYLYNVTTPPFPYSTLLANIGSMRNSGVEIALGFTPVATRDMELNFNANVTYQRNKLLSLSGNYNGYDITAPTYKAFASLNGAGFHGGNNNIVYQIVGQPLGVFYLPHCTGLVSDGKGGYTYGIADLDKSGSVDIEDGKDRKVCGQAVPKVLLGSNISFRYNVWDIAVQINGAFGHKIYNGTSLTYMNMNSLPGYNVLADAPSKKITDQTATDYWLEKGDYVNFDYVTIGWNVPLSRGIKEYVSRLRLALTINNLATISSYSGLTPMINSSNVSGTLGVDDKRTYPLSRTYTIGVNISF
jgi:TonB-linked SusC/RagA family outer membrane protein